MTQKRLKLFVVITTCLAAIILLLFIWQKNETKLEATYDCIYQEGFNHARCYGPDNRACYGYYYLKGTRIEDGINTNSYMNTCEAISTGIKHTFDSQGNLKQ